MTDKVEFNPMQSTHAVERCSATIMFAEAVPERIYSVIRNKTLDSSKAVGLASAPVMGFRLDVATGRMITVQEDAGAPANFTSPDQAIQLMIAPNSINWTTTRYVRWKPFIGELTRALSLTLSEYLAAVSPKSIRLDYADRFFWTGTWDDFNADLLLKTDTGLIAKRPAEADREWHSHCGWFSNLGGLRRLSVANVDVQNAVPVGGTIQKPSVSVITLMQDEVNVSEYGAVDSNMLNEDFVMTRLENLHEGLKDLLKDIIVDPMAARIGLSG